MGNLRGNLDHGWVLVDGSTETGHPLFLILGGAIIGAGAMREIRG